MLKKIIVAITIFLGIATSSINTLKANINDDFNLDDVEINLDDLNHWEEDAPAARVGNLPEGTLVDIGNAIASVIEEPLWKNTRSPRGRDFLYLFPDDVRMRTKSGYSFHSFFNKTGNLHASLHSFLDFAINKENALLIIQKIFQTLPSIGEGASAHEILNLFPIFTKISIQERKNGLMGNYTFLTDHVEFSVDFSPILLSERNFYLDKKNLAQFDAIGEKLFPGEKMNQFHFVRMRFGPGDTRLKCAVRPFKSEFIQTAFGASLVIPTGSLGHTTRLNAINLHSEDLLEMSTKTVRNMRDFLLDAQLGNAGHFSAGIFLHSKIALIKDLAALHCRVSYDKLCQAKEDRLFMNKKTIDPLDLLGLANDEEAFPLLKKFLPQYIIPLPYRTTIKPGDIFNTQVAISFGAKKWHWLLGYDFYHQDKEEILKIHNTDNVDMLRVEDATFGSSYQHKVFVETTYTKQSKNADLLIGVGGNLSVRSKAIGHDWTAYFKIGTKI